ncbi:calpain-7 [Clonorchis sinensis]|uniref:Ubiquitin carboxyl-terminal hydrolase n=1 Tax=Clonorchis sinensis TaxID=79923 RepID=G7YRL9_CLOSI|nr:calpain-7 [Clonorchis sinensis]
MDKVLECVITSDLPPSTKLVVFHNCLTHLNGVDCVDDYVDLAYVCLLYSSKTGTSLDETSRCAVQRICDYLLVRLSDSSFNSIFMNISDKVSSLGETSTEALQHLELLRYLQNIERTSRLSYLLEMLDHGEDDTTPCFTSILRICAKLENLCSKSDLVQRLKHHFSFLVSDEFSTSLDSVKLLVTELVRLLSVLSTDEQAVDRPEFQSSLHLAFYMANHILRLVVRADKQFMGREFCGQFDTSATSHLHSLMNAYLVSAVTTDTCFFPLAALLFCLDPPSNGLDGSAPTLRALIQSVTDAHIDSTDECFALLRRLTMWLLWPDAEGFRSPIDKWIIGFVCEIFKRLFHSGGASANSKNSILWSHFMVDQLRFVIRLVSRQTLPRMSTFHTLTFLLLAGNPDSQADPRYSVIKDELLPLLPQIQQRCREGVFRSDEAETFFSRMSQVTQLLSFSLYNNTPGANGLTQPSDPLDNWDTIGGGRWSVQTMRARLKVYQWSTLARWGSMAGINLRRCWSRWDESPVEDNYDEFPGKKSVSSTVNQRRVLNQSGLRNIGNTCYANAALQLLYHCSDFRLAVLEAVRPKSCSQPARPCSAPGPPCSSFVAVPKLSKLYVNKDLAATSTTGGLLRSQLFALFCALSTHQGQTVRDPGAVLTLSKPAHFVIGEQQDAVEYLNHLLDRLHEEELEATDPSLLKSKHQQLDDSQICLSADRTRCVVNPSLPCHRSIRRTNSSPDLGTESQPTQIAGSVPTDTAAAAGQHMSLVRQLFGGQLVRHTSCTECAHVSSTCDEYFSCLYLPVTSSEDLSFDEEQKPSNSVFQVESGSRVSNTDLDLTSLIQAHFTRTEYVSTQNECESCGKVTKRARRLSLRKLASHVLICLNIFTFCRVKQTSSKILRPISIPERLSVTLSDHTASENGYFCDEKQGSRSLTTRSYALQGMILHHGLSISCGHYTCVARVGMQWIWFDDDIAQYTSLEQVYAQPMTTPYLLLYSQT